MRGPSARCVPNTVLFKTVSRSPDASGDSGNNVPSAGTVLTGVSVQQSTIRRVVVHDEVESIVTHTILFLTPPIDTTWSPGTGPNPRTSGACQTDDQFVWNGRTLVALGAARDEAGRGAMWEVDCEERQ